MSFKFFLRNCNQSSPTVFLKGWSEFTGIWVVWQTDDSRCRQCSTKSQSGPFHCLRTWLLQLPGTLVSKVFHCYSLWENALGFLDSFIWMWRESTFLAVSLSLSCPELVEEDVSPASMPQVGTTSSTFYTAQSLSRIGGNFSWLPLLPCPACRTPLLASPGNTPIVNHCENSHLRFCFWATWPKTDFYYTLMWKFWEGHLRLDFLAKIYVRHISLRVVGL